VAKFKALQMIDVILFRFVFDQLRNVRAQTMRRNVKNVTTEKPNIKKYLVFLLFRAFFPKFAQTLYYNVPFTKSPD